MEILHKVSTLFSSNMLKFSTTRGVGSVVNGGIGLRALSSSSTTSFFGKKMRSQRDVVFEEQVKGHPILKRIPKILLPYTRNFLNAPLSHVTSFLILHEVSAIVPLLGIWYLLHKYQWSVPLDLPSWAIEKGTKIIDQSMEKYDFSSYSLNEKARIVMEGAYAYVIVKALFPVRVLLSLGLMPWFAKYIVVPMTSVFSKKKPQPSSPDPLKLEETKVKSINKPRL